MTEPKFRGQSMKHLTPAVGDILRDCKDGHFVEVLEILEPWTPDGPTWLTKVMAVKIANKHGIPYKKKQEPFDTHNFGYRVVYDVDVPYDTKNYERALKKAQTELAAYIAFTAKHKDKWVVYDGQ